MDNALDLVKNLLENNSSILFCGAGISFNSGIPTVNPLMDYLYHRLDLQEDEIQGLKHSNFPFEGSMEIINDFVNTDPLLDVFNVENPNSNHQLIAELFKYGRISIILTTNFDRNIEIALERIGVHKGRDYEYVNNLFKIQNFEILSSKKYLIKIHGSIEDKASLQAFIIRVANTKNQDTVTDLFTKLFKSNFKNILFCGYSFSDHFDINPAIQQLDFSSKNFYIIEHENNPAIKQIVEKRFYNQSSYHIHYNFDELTTELASVFNCNLTSIPKTGNWKSKVESWISTNIVNADKEKWPLSDKDILAVNLLFKIRRFDLAYKKILTILHLSVFSDKHVLFRMEILQKLAVLQSLNFRFSNDKKSLEESARTYSEILHLADQNPDKFNYFLYSISYGHILIYLGDYSTAEKHLLHAINYFYGRVTDGSEPDPEASKKHFVGSLFQLAATYRTWKKYDKAATYYYDSLKYVQEFGHLESQCLVLYGLGLLYSDINQHKQAIEYFDDCYNLSIKIKLIDRIIECFVQLCISHFKIYGYEEVENFYNSKVAAMQGLTNNVPSLNNILYQSGSSF